ncbi:TlpA family protein disulfide reductase [Neolewinella antarctica]|uniref:Peroxiredoxin n=1 Tax=Neolewinella antarctica TaxID=442734 RepID=A0ABX0XHT8_9BACT|nr:TlpA disulfide reductase family protein [Neolewinella antarctica]NJC28292.1 peroxiredoxin [Neolewinella antarctica]
MLKKFLLPLILLCTSVALTAQRAFPTPTLKTIDNVSVDLSEKIGTGNVTVVAVWATWCQPCHVELDHMAKYLAKWQDEFGVDVLAVSVDKRHQVRKIKPLVSRKGWEYDILIDSDAALQRKLGFRSIPQMYIVDGGGVIVKEFSGYATGREDEVDRFLAKMVSK